MILKDDEYEEILSYGRGLITEADPQRVSDFAEMASAMVEEANKIDELPKDSQTPWSQLSLPERLRSTAKELDSMAATLCKPADKRTLEENLYPQYPRGD